MTLVLEICVHGNLSLELIKPPTELPSDLVTGIKNPTDKDYTQQMEESHFLSSAVINLACSVTELYTSYRELILNIFTTGCFSSAIS